MENQTEIEEQSEKPSTKMQKEYPPRPDMLEPWIFLKEACRIKGVAYNTVIRSDRAYLQPNGGKEDGIVSGRRAWRPETVRAWILLDDIILKQLHR